MNAPLPVPVAGPVTGPRAAGDGAQLHLPDVTLCAAASVNVAATVAAMARCLRQVRFARALLFTDAAPADVTGDLQVVNIAPLRSSQDYSRFMLGELHRWIDTSHCLVVQWDGFITDTAAWKPEFLHTDYIGAPWPQFADGADVGNGGFSLRSRKLLQACQSPGFVMDSGAEDVVICRTNRPMLERDFDIRFAPRELAEHFAYERDHNVPRTFGFHGVFNLIEAVGPDAFWEIYRSLDDRATLNVDFRNILGGLMKAPKGMSRSARMIADRLFGR